MESKLHDSNLNAIFLLNIDFEILT